MNKILRALCLALCILFLCFPAGCGKGEEITSYEIECSLSGDTLTGMEKVIFVNPSDKVFDCVKFNLFGNAFREGAKYSPIADQYTSRAYPDGVNYGKMTISEVKLGGNKTDFEICGEDENILKVPLNKELFPEERVEIEISFALEIADVVARTGFNGHSLNLANFYPIVCGIDGDGFYECVYYDRGDPFFSDCADYEVTLTCDAEYTVASSGKQVTATVEGNARTGVYRIKKARSFAFVLGKEYESMTDNSTGIDITYYFFDDKNPNASMEYAIKSMKYFKETFGEYPYPTYSVVQTEFVQGGMEFPALVMVGYGLESAAYGEVIVHETAHQWWQTTVGNNEIKYGFLDEGLAEYSVVLFFDAHPEYGMTRKSMMQSSEKTYKVFCSVFDKIFKRVDTSMLRPLNEYSGEYEYVNIAYVKPCIMYDFIRNATGDEKFFKSLKRYYAEYSFRNAEPYDIAGAFERSGAGAEEFFKSFYEGKEII